MGATILSSPHIQVNELTSSLESNMQFGALGLSLSKEYIIILFKMGWLQREK